MFHKSLIAIPLAFLPAAAVAQGQDTFTLPALHYAAEALEPAISAETMNLHHGKHHQSFVTTLNKAVADGTVAADATVEDLVSSTANYPAAIRNNAGGHWNHSFFWETMAPADQTGAMSEQFSQAITTVFGSEAEFKAAFEKAGADRFGSGWVWLIVNEDNQLEITSTPNQDNPLMDVAETKGTPLLGNDVWEHAYYLTYNNRRAEYLTSWWDVVNWDEVSERYDAALAE